MYDNITVIICCAGMGTRLGIGTTKALVKVNGKSIICRQLELLSNVKDVRVVVGYQAERVIEEVNQYRKDVLFAFNNDFKTTGVADSLRKGNLGSNKYVVYLDGDILIDAVGLKKIMEYNGECLAFSDSTSDEPIKIKVEENNVVSFDNAGNYSWPGIAKIKSGKINSHGKNVFDIISQFLPIHAIKVDSCEIDTQDDYERAVQWEKNSGKV